MTLELKNIVNNLPNNPGIYQFLNATGKILYIGKAKDLKKRVKAYINPYKEKRIQIPMLMEKAVDFRFIITTTEKEALILENNLIKENRPDYNICLKDDKTYKTICVTLGEDFPKISTVRKYEHNKNNVYFGPYTSSSDLKKALHQLIKLFQIRDCSDKEFNRHLKISKPCLKFQIGNCSGPCASLISKDEYKTSVKKALSFLRGDTKNVINYFKDLIKDFSLKLEYEKADFFYKKILMLQTFEKSEVFINGYNSDADAIAIYKNNNTIIFQVFIIRKGKIISGFDQYFENKNGNLNEIMGSFIEQFYINRKDIPKEIWVNIDPENKNIIADILTDFKGSRVKILVPKIGTKQKTILMAEDNAKTKLIHIHKNISKNESLKTKLSEIFNTSKNISRIECFDVSHTGGHETVGAKVSFLNFIPDKKKYRHYIINNKNSYDDYSSLYEILKRSLEKGINEKKLPDLILIDGGLGQLSILRKALKDFNLEIKAASIAKESHAKSSKDKIFIEERKNPINLKGELMQKFMYIRDEAHRFAITFHKKRRQKKLFN